ncbi:MAG TPA: Clp protease N-terminal domain-containing protein [Bryobacteraceae bacterium]|nr:Clp protease N-terminal domain-containing protein [Bryobacteraceae bacterium]
MFERFTERARRTVFWAHHEATDAGSPFIESEHLLLGVLREDEGLQRRLGPESAESIRAAIGPPQKRQEGLSASTDLPLSSASKRALAYSADEAERLKHKWIGCAHLILGLLRVEDCLAARLLNDRGVDLASYRELVNRSHVRPTDRPSPWEDSPKQLKTAAQTLQGPVAGLAALVDQMVKYADRTSETYGNQQLKRTDWTRKEALGSLIDWASAHHQWLARALVEPKLVTEGYPQNEWAVAQHYSGVSWADLMDLWVGLNSVLVHVMALVPEEKVTMLCRIGIANPVSLTEVIGKYVEHCDDVVGQILARL